MKLSICVPTLNRDEYIIDMVKSISGRNLKDIELVVVDGGKSTETEKIILDNINPDIKFNYMTSELNQGMDLDVVQAVENAKGEYCWLMSDDDVFNVNAIDKILEIINSKCDVYLTDIVFCDENMNKFGKSNFLLKNNSTNKFNISNTQEFKKYINLSTSNNALFCFMPAIIFKRQNWTRFNNQVQNYVYGYNHVYKLFDPINYLSEYNIQYIDNPLLLNRSFNDSFSKSGILNRYLVDFEGYIKLSDLIFKDGGKIKNIFISNMKKEHGFMRVLKLRTFINQHEWNYVSSLLLKFGYKKIFISTINIINRTRVNYYLIPLFEKLNLFIKKIKTKSF